jgi:hypothetical protein
MDPELLWPLGTGYVIVGIITALLHLNNGGKANVHRGEHTYSKPHISEVIAAGALWPLMFTFTVIFGVSRLSLRLVKIGPQLRREARVAFDEAKGKAVIISDKTGRSDYD